MERCLFLRSYLSVRDRRPPEANTPPSHIPIDAHGGAQGQRPRPSVFIPNPPVSSDRHFSRSFSINPLQLLYVSLTWAQPTRINSHHPHDSHRLHIAGLTGRCAPEPALPSLNQTIWAKSPRIINDHHPSIFYPTNLRIPKILHIS